MQGQECGSLHLALLSWGQRLCSYLYLYPPRVALWQRTQVHGKQVLAE